MFRHPAWAVGSYSSGLLELSELSQREIFTKQSCHHVDGMGRKYLPILNVYVHTFLPLGRGLREPDLAVPVRVAEQPERA